jgi:transposase InsO family protein
MKSKTAKEAAKHFWTYCCIYGPPKVVLSDQEPAFKSEFFHELLALTGTYHAVTAPYHPRTNGLIERFNPVLINALRKCCDQHPKDWPEWIPGVELAYRTRIHPSTGYPPSQANHTKRFS